MTQDRHTLAEQIGTLRFLIAREGKSDYIGPTIVDRLRGILTTLEGMAAPENDALDRLIKDNAWRQSMNTMGSGDSPSPQQPTQEALSEALDYLDFPEVPWDKIKDALLPETRNQIIALATLLDRFAAQRVTDLQRERDSETLRAQGANEVLNDLIRERDAATDKTRREGWEQARETCATVAEKYGDCGYGCRDSITEDIRTLITPQNPGIKCAVYSQVPPYRTRCEKCLAAGRCLETIPAERTE